MTLGDKALRLSVCCIAAFAATVLAPWQPPVRAQAEVQVQVQGDGVVQVQVNGRVVQVQDGNAPAQEATAEKTEDTADNVVNFFRPKMSTKSEAENVLRTGRQLAEAGAYFEAADRYLELVTGHPRTVDEVSDAYYMPLWRIALRDIAAWPREGLEAYRDVVRDIAQRAFDDAVKNRDVRRMEQVAQQFFLSSIGDNAAVIVGDRCREAAWPALALFYYTLVLEKYPNSDIPRQELLIRAALAARSAGFLRRYATLAAQIEAVPLRPDISGTDVPATKWLADQMVQEALPDGPSGGRGNRSVAEVVAPATVTWQVKVAEKPAQNRRVYYGNTGAQTVTTPPVYPTLLGDRVYLANLHSAWALDARDGHELWRHDTRGSEGEKLPGIGGSQARQPLVAGDTVYVPLEKAPKTDAGQRGSFYGGRNISADTELYALRADTGEPLWHWDPRGGELESATLSVDGQPVLSGDTVFVALASPGPYFGEIHTAAIDRHTGQLIWAQPIADFPAGFTGGRRSFYGAGADISGTGLAARQGLLLASGMGVTTAQSCLGGGVLWARIVPDMPQAKSPNPRDRTVESNLDGVSLARGPRTLADRGLVIAGFALSPHLWAYSWLDGRVVWKQPAEGARQPLAIVGNRVVAWGSTVRAFDIDTGAPLKTEANWPDAIVGEPVVTGDRVLAPTATSVSILNIATGTIERTCSLPEDIPGGNLALGDSGLIVTSATSATCLRDWETARQQFLAMAEASPEDPSPLITLGAAALRLRKTEEGLTHLDRAMTRNPDTKQRGRVYQLFEDFYRLTRRELNREQVSRLLDRLESTGVSGVDRCRQAFLRADFLATASPRKTVAALQSVLDDPPSRHVRVKGPAGPGVSGILAEQAIGRMIKQHGRRLYEPWDRAASVARSQARTRGDYDALLEVAMRFPNSRAARGALDDAVTMLVGREDATEANRLLMRLVNMTPQGSRQQRYRALLADTSLKLGSATYAAMVASALSENASDETMVPRADGSRTTVAALRNKAEAASNAKTKSAMPRTAQLPKPPFKKVWQSDPETQLARFTQVPHATPRDNDTGSLARSEVILLWNRQKVIAVGRNDGQIRWSHPLMTGTPNRGTGRCYLGSRGLYASGTGTLTNLDPDTGEKAWQIELQPEHRREIFAPRESVTGVLNYGDTGWSTGSNFAVDRIQEFGDKIIANTRFSMHMIDPRDGYTIETVAYPKGVYYGGFIRYGHRTIAVPQSPQSMRRRVLVHNLATGNLDREVQLSSDVIPSAVTSHGSRYWPLFSVQGEKAWVVDMADMTLSPPVAVRSDQNQRFYGNYRMGLATADSVILAGRNQPVRCLDLKTGKERWTFAPNNNTNVSLKPLTEELALVSWNRGLALIRTTDGHVLWRRDFDGATASVSVTHIASRQLLCQIYKRDGRTSSRTVILLDRDTGDTLFEFRRGDNETVTVVAADRHGYLVTGGGGTLEYWVHDPEGTWTWPPKPEEPEEENAEEVKDASDPNAAPGRGDFNNVPPPGGGSVIP